MARKDPKMPPWMEARLEQQVAPPKGKDKPSPRQAATGRTPKRKGR